MYYDVEITTGDKMMRLSKGKLHKIKIKDSDEKYLRFIGVFDSGGDRLKFETRLGGSILSFNANEINAVSIIASIRYMDLELIPGDTVNICTTCGENLYNLEFESCELNNSCSNSEILFTFKKSENMKIIIKSSSIQAMEHVKCIG